jgi:outer membrane protein assembly factor BamB
MGIREKSILAIIVGFTFAGHVFAEDWPQWRGVNRDGVWRETGIVQNLDNLQVRWRKEVANGYCSPTVAGGRVYITDRLRKPDQVERIHCFDANDGSAIWSHSYECRYGKLSYPDGPRASVTIDEGRAYSLGSLGHMVCLDAAKGDVLWEKDLKSEYDIKMPIWGIAAAPLVENDLLILHIGGKNACLIALDKLTGTEKWRALDDRASYSAPIIIDQAGEQVLVCWTGDSVSGLDPATGKLHWRHPFTPRKMVLNIATPVFENGYLFVSGFYDGSLLLQVEPHRLAIKSLWRRIGKSEMDTDSLHCCISTPIIEGDYIYGVDSHGELRCLDLKTGDRIWESLDAVPIDRWSNIHMVRNEDKIWMFNERGELIISKLSPKGFHEISRAKIIEPTEGQLKKRGGVCWSHPAFANKNIYVRNDRELICVDLSDAK